MMNKKKMSKKDLINEYIGIIGIIIFVILALVAIYFYVIRQPDSEIKDMKNATISFNLENTVESA